MSGASGTTMLDSSVHGQLGALWSVEYGAASAVYLRNGVTNDAHDCDCDKWSSTSLGQLLSEYN